MKLRNDESESNADNLISLPYLHEPAILFCLERRYSHGDIYTYTGPILIAMNPFKKVPLYSNQILEIYYNDGLLKSQGIESGTHLPPHVYAIADSAYRLMMQTIMSGHGSFTSSQLRGGAGVAAQSANHSILISGESGAGKTESTKIVLRYLTTVGSSTGSIETESGSVMDKVLKSNPILEAFGNARTLRNDNSSRFGKFIQLNFNKRGHLIGGVIRTYLLEKVRLPSQQRGERNFHIFYQLFAGATEIELIRWDFKAIEQYEYVLQGGIYKLQTIDDKFEYGQLKHALNILSFSEQDQSHLLDLTAALLHLGQVKFLATIDGEGEGSVVTSDSQQYLAIFAKLCCLDISDVIRTLTVRSIVAREETYEKKLTAVQASDARDAVAKAIYGRIFDWIVRTINLSIQVDTKLVRSSIGVLDIFGFECFVHNSFEQLCINYTNETLQQQFNQYIFKMEQIEYQKEKIEWSFIEFPDNQDCLDLIEHRVNGILAMIDDECRLPSSSDTKLASRMYKAYEQNHRFAVSTTQKRDHQFCINHYAGAVVYSSITFVEKNKDELPKEASSLLQGSKQSLLSILFSTLSSSTSAVFEIGMITIEAQQAPVSRREVDKAALSSSRRSTTGSNISMASVGSQFKEQLHSLMESIYATTPHYIRCLKPNDLNVPDNFDRIRIAEQLRYGGVLEAVRVARSGFPVRLSHADFFARYRPLANPFSVVTKELPAFCHKEKVPFDKMKSYCEMLLSALWDESMPSNNPSPLKTNDTLNKPSRRRSCVSDQSLWKNKVTIVKESVQLGLSKVFLRKPAHDVLESRRSRRILSAARRIQARFRCKKMRSWYLALRMAVNLIQNMTRGMLARRKLKSLQQRRAILMIQSYYRMFTKRSKFLALVKSVNALKGKFRIGKSKEKVSAIRKVFHILRLQRIFRGIVCRYQYRKYRSALVSLQCRLRRIRAKEELKQLRIAAKDLGKLQQSNEALKHEIEALKAKAFEDRERIKQDMEKSLLDKANAAKEKELITLQLELANAYKMLDVERQLHQQAIKKLTIVEEEYKSSQSELYQVTEQLKRNNSSYLGAQSSSRSSFRRSSLTATIASEENDCSSSSGTANAVNAGAVSNNTTPTTTNLIHPVVNNNNSSSNARRRSREQQQISQNVTSANENTVIREALEKEILSREALEEEVSRLRQISMDYKAQIDQLRKNPNTTTDNSKSNHPTTNTALVNNKGRGSAITKNATNAKLHTTTSTSNSSIAAATVAEGGEEGVGGVVQNTNSTDDSSLNNWSAAWDDVNDDNSSSVSNDLKSIESSSRTPQSSSNNNSAMRKIDKSIVNPLRKSQLHSSTNSISLDNNKVVDITTALSTFEKNLDMFRTKLKQVVIYPYTLFLLVIVI